MTQARSNSRQPEERVSFWRANGPDGVEFLSGRYRNFVFAPHSHDRYLIAAITSGAIEIIDPARSSVAAAGQIVLCNYDWLHWGHAACEQGWEIRSIYLPLKALEKMSREIGLQGRGTPCFPEVVASDPAIAAKLAALHRCCELGDEDLVREEHVLDVVVEVLAKHADRDLSLPIVGAEKRAVGLARDYLDGHFFENVRLAKLAKECGICRYWLVKAFKSAWGVPPHRYLINVRVRHAIAMLRRGEKPADVALACGFADQSHLTRAFKRCVGVTPGRFRSY